MFESILGQDVAIKQLDMMIQSNKLKSAYLFSGAEGIGKKKTALEFSKKILGVNLENSRDFQLIEAKSGESSIKIERIRALIEDISLKPDGKYKIYVINDAEKMTVQAQNSLLKTLEEPASYGIIILITKNKQALLETIRSRCTEVKFSPLPETVLKRIVNEHGYTGDLADVAVNFSKCYGSASMALDMCNNPKLSDIRELCEVFLEDILVKKDKLKLMNTADYFKEYSSDIEDIINIIIFYIRDCILLKEGMMNGLIINSDKLDFLRKLTLNIGLSSFGKILNILDDTMMKFRSNCNFNTTVQAMVISMMEVVK